MNQAVMMHWALRVLTWAVSILTLCVPIAFLFYFAFSGGIISPEIVEGTLFISLIRTIVIPVLEMAERITTVRLTFEGWNFLLLALAVLAFGLRQLAIIPFQKFELWAKNRIPKTTSMKAAVSLEELQVPTKDRISMLREYSDTKAALLKDSRKMSFLAVDVVGSTNMKLQEDKLAIEHAFAEYRKFVERILDKHNCWKTAWTPDGIMCAFDNGDDAVGAAQDILSQLPWFNSGTHHLKTDFAVRSGVNTGEVVFPEDKAMEEISDRVIDIAGHMQKYANVDSLWIGKPALDDLSSDQGFEPMEREVDGLEVYEWGPSESSVQAKPNVTESLL